MKKIHPVLKTELYKQACAIIKSGKPVELFSEKTECVYVTCYRNSVKEVFKDAYDEGGYEAGTSNFRAGVAELIIEEGKKLVEDLKSNR